MRFGGQGEFVSPGRPPGPEEVRALVHAAHARIAGNTEGKVPRVYSALARMGAKPSGIGRGALLPPAHPVSCVERRRGVEGDNVSAGARP